jgi:dynein light intermediate chain
MLLTEEIEQREKERRATEQRKHEEELQFLKRTNQQLKVRVCLQRPCCISWALYVQTQLESILAPPKK